eukprot:TRINITY_DN5993_c0_g2_i1.p1 TRINITY_DN5993_c0_g2~~TRINITY_DN5993_c0_g2_i1.p1  ORF type:complete len:179 (+),score=72.71 TRINITY_DN5993_c0_g2_i1:58-594(+)
MGLSLARLLASYWSNTEYRILMLGLDCAGKTTTLYKLKVGGEVVTIPTLGFNVETLKYGSITVTVWDVGGQAKIRELWKHYYTGTNGIIFVVDSCDRERVEEARQELFGLMNEPELQNAALLIFANKQDLPNALPTAELVELFQLKQLNKRFYIQSSCAITGEGLYEGLDWLAKAISR